MAADDDDIFGGYDVSGVSDDAFAIPDGTYFAEVGKVEVKTTDEGIRWLTINWIIQDPGEAWHGNQARRRYQLFPFDENGKPVPEEEWDGDTKKGMSRFMKLLREGFDLAEGDRNKFSPSWAAKRDMYVTIVNNKSNKDGDDRVFPNVVTVLSERLYNERQEAKGADADSALNAML